MIGEKEMKRIFSDRNAFRRTVNLAAVQVEGLSDDELSTALAYEVEPYSMIPAAEAEVAWKQIDSDDIAVKSFEVAIVRKQKKRGSIGVGLEKYLKAFVVLAIVLVMALAVDYVLLKRESSTLGDSLMRRAPLQSEIDQLAKRRNASLAEAARVRTLREETIRSQNECERLRGAYPRFFKALAGLGGKVVVKSLSAGDEPFTVKFSFAAINERAGAEVMADLTEALAKCGWELTPGDIGAVHGGGATVEFSGKAKLAQ